MAALALLLACAGCGAQAATGVTVIEVDAPLKSPVWDAEEEAVLALRRDEPRLVKADVTDSGPLRFFRPPKAATVSRELEDAGENRRWTCSSRTTCSSLSRGSTGSPPQRTNW